MSEPFVLVSIVEGDGEVKALPVLLRRMVNAIDPECPVDARPGMRVQRDRLLKAGELERYVKLAARSHGERGGTLVLLDADDDCAAQLGPELRARAESIRPDAPVSVVLAVKEYDAWFIAAAPSLSGRRGLREDLETSSEPEVIRDAKGWLQARRIDGLAYSPTVDQPALSAAVDLDAARAGSASFDKLWREVERLLGHGTAA